MDNKIGAETQISEKLKARSAKPKCKTFSFQLWFCTLHFMLFAFVLGSGQEAAGADLEQIKAEIISLINSGEGAPADSTLRQGSSQACSPQADAALSKLISDEPASVAKGRAIQEIAGVLEKKKYYKKTIELNQYVLDNWPAADYAMWAQMLVAESCAAMKDLKAAKAETDKLIANYGDNPELPWALQIIAEAHRWQQNYEQAKELYLLIIRKSPDSPWADRARLGLARAEVLSLIEKSEFTAAQGAMNKLLDDFGGWPEMPETLRAIADGYKWAEKYDDAERIYQQLARQSVAGDPNGPKMGLAARKAKVMALIEGGREAEAKDAIANLSVDFNGHPDLAETIYWFGRRYEWSNKFDSAREIYEQLMEKYTPGDDSNERSQWEQRVRLDIAKGRILVFLNAGDNRQALRMADQLILDFPQDTFLPDAAARLENEKQKASGGDTGAAVAVWEEVLDGLSSSSAFAAWGYHAAADCRQHRLGTYEQAIKDYEKVVNGWPQYRYAGDAQFAVGACYEALRDSGRLSADEANWKIEQAYSAVAAKYPDCAPARRAFLELGWFTFRRGEWAKSAENFERALERYPQGHRPGHILYPLGRAYEETGQLDKAAKVYREFLSSVAADDPRIGIVNGRLEKMTAGEGDK
jgi:TolA-binding protein